MKKVLIIILVACMIFSGCGKNDTIKSDKHNDEKALGEPNTPFGDSQDIQSQAEVTTTETVTTTAPNVTTTAPQTTTPPTTTKQAPVTTNPEPVDSLSLHKNTPELTKQESIGKQFKLGEVVNIKGNVLTYRIVKVSKSTYEHKGYLEANKITNVYDFEIETCVKNSSTSILNIMYIKLASNNNFITTYSLSNNSYTKKVTKDNISTFHIIIGTNSELNGDYTLILSSQNTLLIGNPIRYTFNSNEIK